MRSLERHLIGYRKGYTSDINVQKPIHLLAAVNFSTSTVNTPELALNGLPRACIEVLEIGVGEIISRQISQRDRAGDINFGLRRPK